jgi:hypothetical protein
MYSRYEMQKDSRSYDDRSKFFAGPSWIDENGKKVTPCRQVIWDEDTGLPMYVEIPGAKREEAIEEEDE